MCKLNKWNNMVTCIIAITEIISLAKQVNNCVSNETFEELGMQIPGCSKNFLEFCETSKYHSIYI